MPERPRFFRSTQTAIETRIQKIQDQLRGNTSNMGALDRDGDMMDDPLLHRLMTERILLEDEAQRLASYLQKGERIDRPRSRDRVSLGHSVHLRVRYPDGEIDEMRVSVGTTLDKQYQEEQAALTSQALISNESPLAQVLMGRRINDKVSYNTTEGTGEVTILGIEDSPLL